MKFGANPYSRLKNTKGSVLAALVSVSSQNHKWSMTVSPNFPSPPVRPSSLHPDPSHLIITVLNLVTSYQQKWHHRLQSSHFLVLLVHFQIKFDENPSRHLEARTESNFCCTGVCNITEPEVTYLVSLNTPSRSTIPPPTPLPAPFPNPVTSYKRKWRHHSETWITPWVVVYLHIQFDSNPSIHLEATAKGIPIPVTSYNRKWRHHG